MSSSSSSWPSSALLYTRGLGFLPAANFGFFFLFVRKKRTTTFFLADAKNQSLGLCTGALKRALLTDATREQCFATCSVRPSVSLSSFRKAFLPEKLYRKYDLLRGAMMMCVCLARWGAAKGIYEKKKREKSASRVSRGKKKKKSRWRKKII